MPSRLVCTYFDSNYLARGIAMIRSLHRVDPAVSILVMALDPPTEKVLKQTFHDQIRILPQSALLAADPALAASRATRSPWAFYATHKPAFLLSALNNTPANSRVYFIDADTWFFSPLSLIETELDNAPIGLSPHRFPPENQQLLKYGQFNAGFLSFLNGPGAIRAVQDWRRDCLDWCGEVPQPGGNFMNQGYLNHWPKRYPGVHIIQHPGANLAPWNVNGHHLAPGPTVDGQPIIFYHFSQTQRDPNGHWYSLQNYFPNQTALVIQSIYRPYAQAVDAENLALKSQYNIDACSTLRQFHLPPEAIRVH